MTQDQLAQLIQNAAFNYVNTKVTELFSKNLEDMWLQLSDEYSAWVQVGHNCKRVADTEFEEFEEYFSEGPISWYFNWHPNEDYDIEDFCVFVNYNSGAKLILDFLFCDNCGYFFNQTFLIGGPNKELEVETDIKNYLI